MPLKSASDYLLDFSRPAKQAVALSFDVVLCLISVWLAFSLRLEVWSVWSAAHSVAFVVSVVLALPIFIAHGLYRAIFRYSGLPALLSIAKAVCVYAVLYLAVFTIVTVPDVPRAVGVLQPIFVLLGVAFSRALGRIWLGGFYRGRLARQLLPRVLIYGAGSAGRQLAAALKTSPEVVLVGYMDDDDRLHGQLLNGLKIHNPKNLLRVVTGEQITQVYLAIPSASRARRNEILEAVRAAHVQVRTLPSLLDLAEGRVYVSDLRELDIEDLLGRDPVPPKRDLLAKNVTGKVVMVTGAGGSIGSELCRQIVQLSPTALLMVELNEFALYVIEQELQGQITAGGERVTLLPLLANVCDASRMDEILRTWKPHTVYHAAAYKHVPLVEHNPAEGVKNNVLGTLNTAILAAKNGVHDFVLISTDKAVRPANVMGASKRLAEMVLQAHAAEAQQTGATTCFSMVRFGNVLGSSGSVVPLFRKQIKDGGPITLTDERITRYFMTIPEAAQLVIQAGAMANGGDVFVLDMGEPVKIIDLAKRMVELSGLAIKDGANPDGDIEIQVTGLRPGEKLYEELLIGDSPLLTSHARIMKAKEEFLPLNELQSKLASLSNALDANNAPQMLTLLKVLVPGYLPDGELVDWIWLANQ